MSDVFIIRDIFLTDLPGKEFPRAVKTHRSVFSGKGDMAVFRQKPRRFEKIMGLGGKYGLFPFRIAGQPHAIFIRGLIRPSGNRAEPHR